jgi:hypothetical protein
MEGCGIEPLGVRPIWYRGGAAMGLPPSVQPPEPISAFDP